MSNPFNIVSNGPGQPLEDVQMSGDLKADLEKLINSADIMVFMKGTPDFPQCGFSANTVGIFNHLGKNYKTLKRISSSS